MAWDNEATRANGRLIRKETITLANSTGGKTQTSTINFIPADADFVVWAVDNDDVDAACAVNVLGSPDDSNYAELKGDLATGLDNNTVTGLYDVSANGDAPYYQVEIEEDGATAAGASKTVTVYVSTPQ